MGMLGRAIEDAFASGMGSGFVHSWNSERRLGGCWAACMWYWCVLAWRWMVAGWLWNAHREEEPIVLEPLVFVFGGRGLEVRSCTLKYVLMTEMNESLLQHSTGSCCSVEIESSLHVPDIAGTCIAFHAQSHAVGTCRCECM